MIKALKPRPLAVLLFVVALVLQLVFCSPTTTTFTLGDNSSTTIRSFGLGSIESATTDGKTQVSFRWLWLASNLALTYSLAAIFAAALAKVTQLRRPATAYGLVASAMIAITLFASIAISKVYWGYFFSKPSLLAEVSEIVKVRAVVPFGIEVSSNHHALVVDTNYTLSGSLVSFKKYDDECLAERVLLELDRKKLLPDAYATTPVGLPDLHPLIRSSGELVESSKGYDSSSQLRGVAVDAIEKSGDRLLFLGFTGGQLSNDHYPCYELFFRGSAESPLVTFVRGQHYFYDAAGMEGFEWYVIWALLAPLGIVVGFVIFTVIAVGRRGTKS